MNQKEPRFASEQWFPTNEPARTKSIVSRFGRFSMFPSPTGEKLKMIFGEIQYYRIRTNDQKHLDLRGFV